MAVGHSAGFHGRQPAAPGHRWGRWSVVGLLAVLSSLSFAQYSSPEMIMVADAGDGTSAHVPQIERYDPTTGAYLGSFGSGYLHSVGGMTVVGQDLYVSDVLSVNGIVFSKIDKFNFSTGAFDGSLFNPSPYDIDGIASYGGNLVVTDFGASFGSSTGGIWTLSPTGATLQYTSEPYSNPENVTIIGNRAWVGSARNGLGYYTLNADGTINGAYQLVAGGSNSYYATGQAKVNGNQYLYDSVTNGTYSLERRDANGALLDSITLASGKFAPYLAIGHNGSIYSLEDGNIGYGTESITRYDGGAPLGLGSMGSFALSNTWFGSQIAVYAAPEPVSLVMFGAGIVGLALRRRRKA